MNQLQNLKMFQKKDKEERERGTGDSSKIKKPKLKKKENTPKNPRQLSFSRKKANRTASIIFFTVIGCSLLFNVIFFSKYQAIRNSAKAAQASIESQLEGFTDSNMLESHSAALFAEDFVNRYINIPQDEQQRIQRLEELQTYFTSNYDIKRLEELKSFVGSRELTSLEYVQTERINKNEALVNFRVTYKINSVGAIEEKKDDEKDPKKEEKKAPIKTVNNSVEVSVPVTSDGKGYAVYETPKIVNRPLKSEIEYAPKAFDGEDVSVNEEKKLKSFLEEFFNAYGNSDEKLKFMSNYKQGLKSQNVQGIVINQATKDESNGEYSVSVDVNFKDHDTSLINSYSYKVQLKKQNNRYFVNQIQ